MKQFLTGLFIGMILALTGCASSPYSGVDINTTNKALVVAIAETRAANLLLQEVIQARVISSGQAQNVLDSLTTTLNALQSAKNSVAASGDPTQGVDALDTAARSLDFVLGILAPLVAQLPPQTRRDLELQIYVLYQEHGLDWQPYSLTFKEAA